MPIKENREYRAAGLFKCVQRAEGSEESYVVEGYATTFEEPYLMYEYEDGLKCYERVGRRPWMALICQTLYSSTITQEWFTPALEI